MKKQNHTLLTTAALFLVLSLASALYAAPIPEPILPLHEAGEYVQRIEELRKKLNEKDGCNIFSSMADKITDEIEKKQSKRSKERKKGPCTVSTRAEFAALEWVYYINIFLTPTTPAEIWEGHWDQYYGQIVTVLGKLPVMSDEFLAAQKIDVKKMRHNRAMYQAILLKKLRGFYEVFVYENLGMEARWLERGIENTKIFRRRIVEGRNYTDEELRLSQDRFVDFKNARGRVSRVASASIDRMKLLDESFFWFLATLSGSAGGRRRSVSRRGSRAS
jgi:hypothetical protein